ncbi:lysophospholipid acyltransferase family protein [Rubritepida flocculans]|uniref:lysophospholipid acyltransferase family protein n=1 Tax=Rubritepida flocculans TaxID=182403 RepID=UPI0004269E70|nr:lysophospholipid acyltransferase family protein [Rubritepida flocculans]
MAAADEPSPVALRSERMMRFFEVAFTRSFAASFTALRVARWGLPAAPEGRPAIILMNHPGWWDGVLVMLLMRRFFRERPGFTPMDAAALEKYRFMKRLGVFGVEQNTARGAVRFLQTAKQVLEDPRHTLWMNAPGRFADVRERPVPLAPGVTRLPEIAPTAAILPVAIEYTHWTEKRGEALVAFGPPLDCGALLAMERAPRTEAIRAAHTAVMDRLAEDAIARDPARFLVAVEGRQGVGGLYGAVQYARALLRGQRHDPRHDPRAAEGR